MLELDDNDLLFLFKNDPVKAYEILFKKYYKILCLQAAFFLRDEPQAEDLVLELFTEVWDKKIYKKIRTSFKSYLYRAVRNKCINAGKKNKLSRIDLENYIVSCPVKKEGVSIERKELEANINLALREFPDQRLKAFTLVYLDNKKYQQAADEMGLSINSIKTHLKIALKTLRKKLDGFK